MFSCEQSFSSTIPPSILDALEIFSLKLRPNYFRFWIPLFVQPCGHSGVCKKCAGEILFCPTCSGLVEGCQDPKFTVPLRPLAFGDAFNSSIQPDVEMPSEKAKRNRTMNTSMEIFGGREPELHSQSEESSEDKDTILNCTPVTTMYTKPKRICALTPTVKSLEEYGSKVELKDHEDCAVEDNSNHELSQPRTPSEPQIGPTTRIIVFDSECTANVPLLHEESNTMEIPVAEMDGPTSHTSTGSKFERDTSCGSKRRNTSKSQTKPKRMTRHHSKHTQAKEVLRLLADQQTQQESSASVRVRRGRNRS